MNSFLKLSGASLLLIFSLQANAQIKKAEALFDQDQYAEAVPYFQQALEKNDKAAIRYELAVCYLKDNQPQQALELFEQLLQKGAHKKLPLLQFDYAQCLQKVGEQKLSKVAYAQFLQTIEDHRVPLENHNDLKEAVAIARRALEPKQGEVADSLRYSTTHFHELEELGQGYGRFSPSLLPGRASFMAHKEKESGENAYRSFVLNNKKWQMSDVSLPSVAVENHQGGGCLSPDGNTFYFVKRAKRKPSQIYIAHKKNGQWQKAKVMRDLINDPYYDNISPQLSPTGDTLFFASNRPQGKGKFDIYFARKGKNDHWGRAHNLSAVNTEGNEINPFFDGKYQQLVFSSDGYGGMGGYDMFVYRPKEDVVANLGAPYNSENDDCKLAVLRSQERVIFNSNRTAVEGFKLYEADLFRIIDSLIVRGRVLDSLAQAPMMAKLTFTLQNAQHEDSLVNINLTTDSTGAFEFKLPKAVRQYAIVASADGYVTKLDTLKTQASDTLVNQLIELSPVIPDAFDERIYFDFDKNTIKQVYVKDLQDLMDFLQKRPNINIEVQGYTDSYGSKAYNIKLGERRAKAVQKYLVEHGVDPAKLTTKSFGEDHPFESNKTLKGRKANRRVEFDIK
ncbi:OmpA family protein [Persicobacter psychrovividus]|uniref:Cell envelope biogenesis protein OmpA n=1 Tax=Persicobacter psychrovividus TaxID=387638 RepID=A0ABN6LJT7_9BACT|nr:cell envelope biogenesis protein OmpA [Persicobacter psychrovividus]